MKIDQLSVRSAGPADARALGEIWFEAELESLKESYPGRAPGEWFTLPSAEWCAEYWDFHIPSPGFGCRIFVAERAGCVEGFALAGPPDTDEDGSVQIHSLYVRSSAWGTGVGTSLLAAAVGWLSDQGHADAFLWAVQGNLRSRSFYEARGWRSDGAFMRAKNGLPLVRYTLAL